MNSTYRKYIAELKKRILNEESSQYMLIKHYSAFDFDEEIDCEYIAAEKQIEVIKFEFSYTEMCNPFEPFLGWIRSKVNSEIDDIDEFLDKMNVYSMHKSIFKSFLKTGICCRKEEFIDHSYIFESKCIYKAMLNMVEYFCDKHKTVFVLNKLHCVDLSTITLLNMIIDNNNKINIIAGYNESYPIRNHIVSLFDRYIEKLEQLEMVYIYDENFSIEKEVAETSRAWSVSRISEEETIKIMHNKISFLEFGEALYYLDIVYDKVDLEKMKIDDNDQYIIYKMYIDSLIVISKYSDISMGSRINDVLLVCDKMKHLCENSDNTHNKYIYCYNLARIYMLNGQDKNAAHYITEANKLAKKMKRQYALNGTLGYTIGYYYDITGLELIDYLNICCMKSEYLYMKILNDVSMYSPDEKDVPVELIETMRKYEYYDHLAEILNLCSERGREVYEKIEGLEECAPMIMEAEKVGKMIGNNAFLRSFYRVNVMRASNAGYFETANYFCQKVLEVIGDDEMQAAYTYIGMGYNCCTIEQYEIANEYFSIALRTCYKYHDIKHIAEIMYNLAVNAMLAYQFNNAIEYLNCALDIMQKMSYVKLFACNAIKISALKAICCYRLGKIYLCKMEFKKIERNIDFKPYIDKMNIFNEDKYFYYYIKSLLMIDAQNWSEAEHAISEAEELLGDMEGFRFFNYVQIMIDKCQILDALDKQANIDRIVSEVVKYCDEKGYQDKKMRFLSIVKKQNYIERTYHLSLKDITFKDITSLTDMEQIKQLLVEKKNEEEFLTKWQNIMSNPGETLNELTDMALNAFVHNFSVDGFVMIYSQNGGIKAITKNISPVLNKDVVRILWDFFEKSSKEAFFMTANDKNYEEYKYMIDLFNSDKIFSLFGAPFRNNNKLDYAFFAYSTIKSRKLISEHGNLQLMNSSYMDVYIRLFRQLIDTIYSFEKSIQINAMNEKLRQFAHNDMLTGLLNRKGLEERLKEMFETDKEEISEKDNIEEKNYSMSNEINNRVRRIKTKYRFYSVMYIDLDNFKYYNDTFGHDIGDLVLIGFAEIIKSVCHDTGLAIRYGGDEFMLVLKNLDRNSLIEIVENIYYYLEDQNYFIDLICEEMNEIIDIPEEYKLSCSIGIAGFKVLGDEGMEEFVKAVDNADKALYHVKKTTKHNYAFYTK